MVLRRATELQLTTSIVGMVLSSFGLLSAVSLNAFIILGRYHRADKAMILRQAEEGGANVGPGLVFSNLHGQHPERAHAWAGGRGGPTEGRLLAATVVSWQRLGTEISVAVQPEGLMPSEDGTVKGTLRRLRKCMAREKAIIQSARRHTVEARL
eukprot:jgi/Tetstr1/436344/TSEL_025181.t1